jgi:hypothetical protein
MLMVVSKVEFHDAMEQINESYARLLERIKETEDRLAKLESEKEAKTAPKSRAKAAA